MWNVKFTHFTSDFVFVLHVSEDANFTNRQPVASMMMVVPGAVGQHASLIKSFSN